MNVALPCTRQPYQLLAIIFAADENLQKDEKRLAPVLEIEKAGVLLLNMLTRSTFGGRFVLKGVMP